jgi:uracil-DNA glycosylase
VTALADVLAQARACRVCETALGFAPRPIVQAGETARLLIVGQAPGSRVHAGGKAWDDDSGTRLREWLGLESATFYFAERVALVPMGLCYPGKGNGGDLPPRRECAPLWHPPILAKMPNLKLTLLVGQYAQAAFLPRALRSSMTEAVRRHEDMPAGYIALPHPAWRSRLWMAKHPWFEAEVLPRLRARVAAALA